jgi:class 3 adenylate cyclase
MALCTSCGTDNPERAKFCLECGAVLPAAEGSRGARKLVTVLFADVVGSTALGEQLDPETMRGAMARYFTAARTVLERHGGTVEKFIGDAVMAVFGVPLLHEDDALRAVRAAIELRAEIGRLNEQLSAERGFRVEFRIGVNSGMVVAGGGEASGSFVTGDAVNVAARLEQAAGTGEILIGEATHRLVRDYVEVEALPSIAAKGKSDVVRAFRLTGLVSGVGAAVRSAEHGGLFVGRRRELSRLNEAFDDAVAERRCFLFTLLGSAGVGKSRLVAEFMTARAPGASVLRGRCLPYGEGITYWPIAEIVRAASGATDDDDAAAVGARIAEQMTVDPSADRVAELLTSMLGLSTANATGEERAWAVRRFLEAVARDAPLICLIEDVHWAETNLLDLLEGVADWTRDAPILLLCTARPELLEARPTWGGGKVNATTLLLEPLNVDATRELVGTMLGGASLPTDVIERILATSEGNPLFAEELVRMVTDDTLAIDGADLQIPTSVQAVIAARLDRLPAQERSVAARAAVAGRVFERSAVFELMHEDERERVPDALLSLMRKELVQPSQPDLTADEAFRFRHIVIRDTAYEGLPKEERANLHERFAGWVERVAGERLDEYAEILGYHLEQAVRYRRELGLDDARSAALADRAGERLKRAGTRTYLRGDGDGATKLLQRSVALLPPGKSRREALVTWCRSSGLRSAWRDVLVSAERLAEEARLAGDELDELKARMLMLGGRALTDPTFAISDEAESVAAALTVFERASDVVGMAFAEEALTVIYLGLANWRESGAAAERALGHSLAAGDGVMADEMRFFIGNAALWGSMPVADTLALSDELIAGTASNSSRYQILSLRAMAHAMAGDAVAAHADIADATRIKRELGDPSLAWLFTPTPIEMILGDLEAAEREADWTIGVLERLGESGQRSTIFGFRARNSFDRGRPDDEILTSVAECRRLAASDDAVSQLQWRAALALVAARAGRIDEAKRWIGEGAAKVAHSDFLYELGLTAQDRGYIHQCAGELDDARREYEAALVLFEQKGDVMDAARVRERLAALG